MSKSKLFNILFLVIFISTILKLYSYNELKLFNIINNSNQQNNRAFLSKTIIYNKLEKFKKIHDEQFFGLYSNSNKTIFDKRVKLSFNLSPNAGYGNRLYSMLSSLVIAIVTNSSLLVKWNNIENYIQEPLNGSFWRQFQIDDDEFYSSPIGDYVWSRKKNMTQLIKTFVPLDKHRIKYDSINGYFFEICCNPTYYDLFLKYDLTSETTIQQAIKAINNMNANNNEQSQNLIMKVGFEVGGNLLNQIWLPRPYLIEKINKVLKEVFQDYFVIGIQLRYQYISDIVDTIKFIRCAQMIEKKVNHKRRIKWFVTSDSASVIERLKKDYTHKLITNEGKIGHILLEKDSYERTIIDIELLSKCDELIITGGSTYGFIAAMKTLKLPYYFNGGGIMKECQKTELGNPSMTNTGYAVL